MTIFVSSCRNKLTKKYAKKNGTPCILFNYASVFYFVFNIYYLFSFRLFFLKMVAGLPKRRNKQYLIKLVFVFLLF